MSSLQWLRRFLPHLAGAFVLAAVPASAQQIRGTVTELGTEAPLAGAVLTLLDGDSVLRGATISDSTGGFVLEAAPEDSLRLRIRRLGYAELLTLPIRLQPQDSLQLEIRMRPQAVMLEGVTATGGPRLRRELSGFLQRRETGFGRYFGPDELAGRNKVATGTMLAALPGSFLMPAGQLGAIVARQPPTKLNEVDDLLCTPSVFLDGMLIEPSPLRRGETTPAVPVESVVASQDVLGVEIYRNPAHAPSAYQRPFMDCTVVLIWTNYSFGIGGGR